MTHQSSLAPTPQSRAPQATKTALASFVGTLIEWYDFFIFGTAAALVFNVVFFSNLGATAGTLAAFATFGVAFVARPFGAVLFGHFGDRIGRKKMLVASLLCMGLGTFFVGLLPGYATIGIWAPLLLVAARLAQGVAVGGEWGGAVLMAVEHAPPGRRAFYGSFPQVSVPCALVLSTLSFLAVRQLPEETFLTWGWRIPFLASIVLVAVGLYIRLNILESPEFTKTREEGHVARVPIAVLVTRHWRRCLAGIGSVFSANIPFYLTTVFVISYAANTVGLGVNFMLWALVAAAVCQIFTIPLFAVAADRFGPRNVLLAGSVVVILLAAPFFWLIDSAQPVLVVVAMIASLAIGHAWVYAPSAGFLSEIYPPNVRYTGTSVSYHVGGALASGPVPLVAASLVAWAGNTTPLVVYMMLGGAVAVVALLFMPNDRPGRGVRVTPPDEPAAATGTARV